MNPSPKYDETRFFSWLAKLLNPDEFDIVVTVERKATAFMRALLDLMPDSGSYSWSWNQVLSSDALRYLPRGWLGNKRILVFNEMIHLGDTTKRTIEAIRKNTPGAETRTKTAAFIVHDDFYSKGKWRTQSFRDEPKALSPDYALERGVSQKLYAHYRDRLIDSLRNKGALLLDTEHLESTFKFTMPIRRFLDALGTFGLPVQYEVDEEYGFPGITVTAPAVPDVKALAELLPTGTDLDLREPQKIRLVRRSPKEFAFIPIWYPPIPLASLAGSGSWAGAPCYMVEAIKSCPEKTRSELAFHLCSLITGVELLKSVWGGLAPFVEAGVEPDVIHGSNKVHSPLGHLRALYPLLDFDALEHEINSAVSEYKDRAFSKRVQLIAGWGTDKQKRLVTVGSDLRDQACHAILRKLVRDQREFSIGDDWFENEILDDHPKQVLPPLIWHKFWEAGEQLGFSEEVRTIVMDTLIDNAVLKTSHTTIVKDGSVFILRAFEPDSEFAQEALEKMAYGGEELCLPR